MAVQRPYEGRIKATAILPFCHKSLHSSCATEINASGKRKRKPQSHHDELVATVRLLISRKESSQSERATLLRYLGIYRGGEGHKYF